MQQSPVEFPVAAHSRTGSGRTLVAQVPHSGQSSDPLDQRAYFFTLRTSLAIMGLACLGLYIAARLPQWDNLFARQSASSAASDPVLASILQWVPILLILVSCAVLALMALLSLRERRTTPRLRGLMLVPTTHRSGVQPILAASSPKPEDAPNSSAVRPFLVENDDRRHTASEEIRLDRDARASAAQRSAAASQLRIRIAARPAMSHDTPDPVVRRSFMRRKTFSRDKAPTPITAKLQAKSPDEGPARA